MTDPKARIVRYRERFEQLRAEVSKVMVGRDEETRLLLLCLFGGGHVLVEGLPGLGKTRMVSTLASALGLEFRRIQFTPDLMPSDITGTDVLVRQGGATEVRFQPGPVFCNVLLADEVNRAAPRTQSALLEVMQERSVTMMGVTRRVPEPFFVFATQNPIELEGTYPLPEAQLDRFMMKVVVRASGADEIRAVLDRFAGAGEPRASVVMGAEEVLAMQALVREVVLPDAVARYISQIVVAGQPDGEKPPEPVRRYVKYGPSPRGALALALAAKASALAAGRPNVDFSDVDPIALPVLRHRFILNFEGEAERADVGGIVASVLETARRRV